MIFTQMNKKRAARAALKLRNIFCRQNLFCLIAYLLVLLSLLSGCVSGDSIDPAYTGDLYPAIPGKSLGDVYNWWGSSYIADLNTWNGTAWEQISSNVSNYGDMDVLNLLGDGTQDIDVDQITANSYLGLPESSNIILLDNPPLVIDDTNRTSTLDWTDLDLTAYSSVNTVAYLIRLTLVMDSWTSGQVDCSVRENGLTPTYVWYCYGNIMPCASNASAIMVVVGCDSEQTIEYRIRLAGTAQVDTRILVVGYIE